MVRDLSVRRLSRRWGTVVVPKVGPVRFRITRLWADITAATSARVTLRSGRWHVCFTTPPADKITAEAAAVCSSLLGLGFGLPCLWGMVRLARTGEVWTFLGFPTYGGGPFERWGVPTTVPLMAGFLLVCAVEVVVGVLLWTGASHATTWHYALLPFEVAFWVGLALPFGPVVGIARVVLVLLA